MILLNWKENLHFEANTASGHSVQLDSYPEEGQTKSGPTPVEYMLMGIAGCAAMDVISILEKKRQVVTSYTIEIDGVRGPEGVYPRPFTEITVVHRVSGENLDPVAVERAVQLSEEKYCTVMATVRSAPVIKNEIVLE